MLAGGFRWNPPKRFWCNICCPKWICNFVYLKWIFGPVWLAGFSGIWLFLRSLSIKWWSTTLFSILHPKTTPSPVELFHRESSQKKVGVVHFIEGYQGWRQKWAPNPVFQCFRELLRIASRWFSEKLSKMVLVQHLLPEMNLQFLLKFCIWFWVEIIRFGVGFYIKLCIPFQPSIHHKRWLLVVGANTDKLLAAVSRLRNSLGAKGIISI